MKRIVTLLLLCAAFLPRLVAQDIIITTDEKRIEAKILTVSSAQIEYKDWADQEGPTFILTAEEINTIIYQNGKVKVFEHKQAAAPQAGSVVMAANGVPAFQPGVEIRKDRDDNYWLGNVCMPEEVYFNYIQANCQAAWDSYRRGLTLFRAGWGLFGVGVGIFFTGFGLAAEGGFGVYTYTWKNESERKDALKKIDRQKSYWAGGAALISIGSAALSASVPLLIVGAVKKNNSHEVYNEECARRSVPMSLNLTTGSNGLGLAFAF